MKKNIISNGIVLFFAMFVLSYCTPSTDVLFIVNNKSAHKTEIPKEFDWSVESIGLLLDIDENKIESIDVIKETGKLNVDCILLMTVKEDY